MNTLLIVGIVAVVLALVLGILWCVCQRSFTPRQWDTEQGLDDEPEVRRPATNPRIGIRKKHALVIHKVLEKDVVIPTTTRRKHIYWGNPKQVFLTNYYLILWKYRLNILTLHFLKLGQLL